MVQQFACRLIPGDLLSENNKQNNFDANGNLLHLDNIANLDWYYNNVQNIHAYLHEVVEVRQQILKAFLILNVGE
jgi:hypothetical protein